MRDQNLKLIQIYKIKRVEHLRKLKDEIFIEFYRILYYFLMITIAPKHV